MKSYCVCCVCPNLPPSPNPQRRTLFVGSSVTTAVCSLDIPTREIVAGSWEEVLVITVGHSWTCSGWTRSLPSPKPRVAFRFVPQVYNSLGGDRPFPTLGELSAGGGLVWLTVELYRSMAVLPSVSRIVASISLRSNNKALYIWL